MRTPPAVPQPRTCRRDAVQHPHGQPSCIATAKVPAHGRAQPAPRRSLNPTPLGCSHPLASPWPCQNSARPSAGVCAGKGGPRPRQQQTEIRRSPAQPRGCTNPHAIVARRRAIPTEQDPSRTVNRIRSPEQAGTAPAPASRQPSPGPGRQVGASYLGDGDGLPEVSSPGNAEAPRGWAGQGHHHRHGSGRLWAGRERRRQETPGCRGDEAEESSRLPPRGTGRQTARRRPPPPSPLHPSGSQSLTPRVPGTGSMETGSAFLPGRGSASSRRRRVSAATAASSCCPGAPGQGWWLSPLPSPPRPWG